LTTRDEDYLNLFRDFPDGLFQTDLDGNYIMVNKLYAGIFGYTLEEMMKGGFNLRKTWVIEDEVRLLLSEVKKRAIKGIVIKSRDMAGNLGRIELSIGVRRNDSDEIIGYEGRARDITQRYNAMNAEVESRQNAEFLIDLMAHDLNNIHQGMLMPLEYILSDKDYPDQFRRPLELSVAQIQYATDLIKNVKRLQRVFEKSDKLTSINLSDAINEAAETAKRAFPFKQLEFNFKPEPIMVHADNMLKDMFFNLFHNALKHDSSEDVSIDVEIHPGAKPEYLEIHVKDNGPGVPDEEKMRILQRRMGAKGSGIGLTIVNYLLDRYDGAIRVTDRKPGYPSMGCNFVVEIRRG
jgi:PAS domain S-box-containing protein